MNSTELGELFRKYEVFAASVEDFLAKFHRKNTYTGRGDDYAAGLLASYEADFARDGWCFTSHHDSNTGEVVAYFGRNENAPAR